MSGYNRGRGNAFISYAHANSDQADELQRSLEAANIPVWRDTVSLWPGEDWRQRIRRAITTNSLAFIACFSRLSISRSVSYQNEELVLAIEQLRLRRPEEPWFIPVRFDECKIPDRDIGGGRTLASIQCVDIFGDRLAMGTARLIAAVLRILDNTPNAVPITAGPMHHPLASDSKKSPGSPTKTAESAASPALSDWRSYRDHKQEYSNYQPGVEEFMFGLSTTHGGLIVYANPGIRGQSLTIVSKGTMFDKAGSTNAANVVQRTINGQTEFAAVFSSVSRGQWVLKTPDGRDVDVSIYAMQIAEIDLR